MKRLYYPGSYETTYWNASHTSTTWQNDNPNYQNSWKFSDSQNAIVSEQDFSPPKFFISPKAEYYNFYLKLSFTSWDDDAVILIPGFMTDSKGVEHTLTFLRSSSGNNMNAPITGWVDKEQCGVWFWGRWTKPENCIVSLYHMPGLLCSFIKITGKYPDCFDNYSTTNNKAFPVLDYKLYKGEYWIKTVIVKDEKKIVGWTKDYCPNVYGSCN